MTEIVVGKPFFKSNGYKGEEDHYYSKKLSYRKENDFNDGRI
jgi:hypothetical protein